MSATSHRKSRPVLDDTLLRALGPRPDVAQVVAELAEVFLGDAFRRLGVVRQQVERGNLEDVRRFAHAIKGSSLSFGACRVARMAAALEAEADAGVLSAASVTARIELLAYELEVVRKEVHARAGNP